MACSGQVKPMYIPTQDALSMARYRVRNNPKLAQFFTKIEVQVLSPTPPMRLALERQQRSQARIAQPQPAPENYTQDNRADELFIQPDMRRRSATKVTSE
jgi:hypothetical protein